MDPILLIHGYSAESKKTDAKSIANIYGSLPEALRKEYGAGTVVEIDVSRYVSLEDGVTIDDISRALNRALQTDFPSLLERPFHVIIHSTGALVIRNWVRRFSKKPSPIRKLVYLAGANFGSGWAHIGKGQLAQWARFVFQGGAERGVRVLGALELGSDWTLDLHLHFLQNDVEMAKDFRVQEHVIIGTQADVKWFEIPIRYAKEDGSDGVVRVAAANLNFNYIRFEPTKNASEVAWKTAENELLQYRQRMFRDSAFYEIKKTSRPGEAGRPEAPFAIPYECAHSGEEMGVVTGKKPRDQVMRLLKLALETPADKWPDLVPAFKMETDTTYSKALVEQAPSWWKKWIEEPRAQYDHHAQVIFRLRDQDGRPVTNFDIFFNSVSNADDPSYPLGKLIEDKHINEKSPNIVTFYFRTHAFDSKKNEWVPRLKDVNGCFLEISAVEPETGRIIYLPFRHEFGPSQLEKWIEGHRTTLIDVELLRLPAPEIFNIKNYSPG